MATKKKDIYASLRDAASLYDEKQAKKTERLQQQQRQKQQQESVGAWDQLRQASERWTQSGGNLKPQRDRAQLVKAVQTGANLPEDRGSQSFLLRTLQAAQDRQYQTEARRVERDARDYGRLVTEAQQTNPALALALTEPEDRIGARRESSKSRVSDLERSVVELEHRLGQFSDYTPDYAQTQTDLKNAYAELEKARQEDASYSTAADYQARWKKEARYKELAEKAAQDPARASRIEEGRRRYEEYNAEAERAYFDLNKTENGPEYNSAAERKWMEDADKETFFYLYATDPEAANEWAEYARTSNRDAYFARKQELAGLTPYNRIQALASGTLANLAAGPVWLLTLGDEDAMDVARGGNAVLSGASQGLTERGILNTGFGAGTLPENIPIVGGKGLGEFYQIGSSMLQSAAAAALGPTGGALVLASSAAASDYTQMLDQGVDKGTAVIHAACAGIAEALFEKVSLENLVSQDLTKGFWKNALAQAGIEASEEINTTLANTITDEAILGSESSRQRRITELMAQGMSAAEARKQANTEWLRDTLYDGLSGAISGFGMTGGNVGVQSAVQSVNQARAQRAINAAIGADVAGDAELANALNAEAQKRGMAQLDPAVLQRAQQAAQRTQAQQAAQRTQAQQAAQRTQAQQAAQRTQAQQAAERAQAQQAAERAQAQQAAERAQAQTEATEEAEDETEGGENEKPVTRRQERETRREERKAQRDYRAVGKQASAIVESVSAEARQNLEGKTVAEAENALAEITKRSPRLAGAVESEAFEHSAKLYQGAESLDKLNTRHADNVRGLKDAGLRAAAEAAYDEAAERFTPNRDEAAKVRRQGRYASRDGALDLSASYERGGETVKATVKNFAQDGQRVVLDNGETVALDKVSLDPDAADVLGVLRSDELGAAASEVLTLYNEAAESGKISGSGYGYLMELRTAVGYGRNNTRTLAQTQAAVALDAETAKRAYEIGQEARRGKYSAKQAALDARKAAATERGTEKSSSAVQKSESKGVSGRKGSVDTTAVKDAKLNRKQRIQLAFASKIAEALGLDVVITADNRTVKRGGLDVFVGRNGAYQGGKLYLDINAGRYSTISEASGILRAMSHELTHFIEDYSPELYEELKAFAFDLLGQQYGAAGFADLVNAKLARDSTGKLTEQEAEDEILADACETMLRNSEAVKEALAAHESLGDKLLDWLARFVARLREIFGDAAHEEARFVDSLDAQMRRVWQEKWDAALRDAAKTHEVVGDNAAEASEKASERDAAYLEAVERGDMETAQRMVDEAARAAGYLYRRNTRRKLNAENGVSPIRMFVYDADGFAQLDGYGKNRYAATDAGAIRADDITDGLLKLAREYFAENDMDASGLTEQSVNPADIVSSAQMWDDADFVQYAWDNYFEAIYNRTGNTPALVTDDGLIVFGDDDRRIKSLDPVTYDSGKPIPLSERFNAENEDIRFSEREESEYTSGGYSGNGYDGYSMSNNARAAYSRGEMPLSKWTKTAIMERVAEIDNGKVDLLKGVDAQTLKKYLLTQSGWHHTSSMYNRTNFYEILDEDVEGLTQETVDGWVRPAKETAVKDAVRGDFYYTEWGGTRNHPKATNKVLKDVSIQEKGSFYIVYDDAGNVLVRKKIGSNGTRVVSYAAEELRRNAARQREENRIANSTEAANELYAELRRNGMESSTSGNIYAQGRKPSRIDYANGIENFFRDGERRLTPNRNGGYSVETFRNGEWVREDENAAKFSERDAEDMTDEELLMSFGQGAAQTDEQRRLVEDAQKTAARLQEFQRQYNLLERETRAIDRDDPHRLTVKDFRQRTLDLFNIPAKVRGDVGAFIENMAQSVIGGYQMTDNDLRSVFEYLVGLGRGRVQSESGLQSVREFMRGRYVFVDEQTRQSFADTDYDALRKKALRYGLHFTTNRDSANGRTASDLFSFAKEINDTLGEGFLRGKEYDGRGIMERLVELAESGRDRNVSLSEAIEAQAQSEGGDAGEIMDELLDRFLRTYEMMVDKAALEAKARRGSLSDYQKEKAAAKEAKRELNERLKEARKQIAQLRKEANSKDKIIVQMARDSFDRIEAIKAQYEHDLMISGINLRAAQFGARLKDMKIEGLNKEIDRILQSRAKTVRDFQTIIEKAEAALQKQIEREQDILSGKLTPPGMQKILKEARKTAAAEVRERKDAQIERMREQRKIKEIKGRLVNLADTMRKQLLHPQQRRYVPQQFIGNVLDMFDLLNFGNSKKAQKDRLNIAALNAQYDELGKSSGQKVFYDPVVKELMVDLSKRLDGRNINQLSHDELQEAYRFVRALYTTIRNTVRADEIEKGKASYEIGYNMMQELRRNKGGLPRAAEYFLSLHLDARRMFNRFGGYVTNSYWNKTFEMLNNASHEALRLEMEATKIFEPLFDTKKQKEQAQSLADYSEKGLVDIGLKDEHGNAVKITHGMMLATYMLLLNEDSARHIMYGGLTMPDLKRYYGNKSEAWGRGQTRIAPTGARLFEIADEMDALDPSDLPRYLELEAQKPAAEQEARREIESIQSRIESKLTSYERAWVKAAQKFFDGFSKDAMNRTTMELYGFRKALVEHYFPIHTDPDFIGADWESISRDLSLENLRITKERVEARNPILLEDLTRVIDRHIHDISRYAGLTKALKTFKSVYNVQTQHHGDSLQKSLAQSSFGERGQKFVENLMADLNGARKQGATIFDRVKGKYAQAVLSANLSVTLKQTASYPAAAAVVGWKALGKAFLAGGKDQRLISRANRELIDIYTPLMWARDWGAVDSEIGEISNAKDWTKDVPWLMGWIKGADKITVGRLWSAAEYYVRDNYKGLLVGSNEDVEAGQSPFYQKVAEVFNRIVEETQPNYSVLQRPDILRNPNAIIRSLTMFMTQRLQNSQIVFDALAEYRAKTRFDKAGSTRQTRYERRAARGRLAHAVSSQIVSAMVLNAMTLGVAALLHRMNPYRDDDEELTGWSLFKAYMEGLLSTFSGTILGGQEIFNALNAIFSGEEYYGSDVGGVSVLSDMLDNIVKFGKGVGDALETEDGESAEKWASFAKGNYKRVIQSVGQLTGIPADNLYKIGEGIYRHVDDAMTTSFGSFESGVTRKTTTNVKRWIEAKTAGDERKASSVLDEMHRNYADAGKDEGTAEDEIAKGLHSRMKEAYKKGESVEALESMLEDIGISEDATAKWNKKTLGEMFRDGKLDEEEYRSYLGIYAGIEDEDKIDELVNDGQSYMEFGSAPSGINQAYRDGELDAEQAVEALTKYGGKSREEAEQRVAALDFSMEHGWELSDAEDYLFKVPAKGKQTKSAEQFGITPEEYAEYKEIVKNTKGTDVDGDGTTDSGSKKKAVLMALRQLGYSGQKLLWFANAAGYVDTETK